MTRASGAEPPRLARRDDRAGRLLREAEHAFRSQLSPELAWKRFQIQRQRRWVLRFAVVAAAMATVIVFARLRLAARVPVEAATLVAEQVPATQPSPLAPPLATPERRVPPSTAAVPRPRSFVSAISPASVSSARATVDLSAEPMTDATCRAWVSRGHADRAVECYRTIARESGIGAEVALYEAARLSTEALDDAQRALALLDEHSARFPHSVLRVEVKWLEIRSLERSGRLDQALSASEALLDSPAGRSLAPKLHLLRGRIYARARHECALALPEYVALLGEPGPAGDEAEFNRALCLEQLHKADEARAAYQRYLERADARSADVARARLSAIANAALPVNTELPTQATQAQEGQP